MSARRHRSSFLPIEEVSPTVDLADCWKYETGTWFRYRVPSHHLILIESGCILAQPPGDEFDAHAGDLIWFRSARVNRYRIRETAVFYQTHLRFAPPPRHEWTPLGESGPAPTRIPLGNWFAPMRRVFETLCMEVSQTGAVHQFRLRMAVWELLTILAEVLTDPFQARTEFDNWDRLRLRLDAKLRQQVTIDELADEWNMSRGYLIRRFKQRFGLSPKAYLTHARLREATRLLRSTDLPVKLIALDLGFPSIKAFERLFKHHTGRRPMEARSQPMFTGNPLPNAPSNPFQINQHNIRPDADAKFMLRFKSPDE